MIPRKHFKTQKAFDRQGLMCPEIQTVMKYAVEFAIEIDVACPIITETVTTLKDDRAVGRKHDQHRRGVAFDLRVKDWSGEQIDALELELDKRFRFLAYVTASGTQDIAFCHGEGDNLHFHVAVNARYKKKEFKG